MTVIDRTFHDLSETQKWLESYDQQPKAKTIRVIISDEESEDDFFASLTPEQQQELEEGIARGRADVKAGRVLTCDQARQRLQDEFDKKRADNKI